MLSKVYNNVEGHRVINNGRVTEDITKDDPRGYTLNNYVNLLCNPGADLLCGQAMVTAMEGMILAVHIPVIAAGITQAAGVQQAAREAL